ncbi:MAG: A24 family peptidase [Bacteroides sp.]|nr:A24 family peptidase [Bacteroides sp.]MCM1549968.1 A24 family peptidase [Clostridium sp.]
MAVVFDLRSYRIPNLLIVIGLTVGISWSFYNAGWNGLLESVAGIGLPVVVLFLLHQLRMLGAGDIKLFSVIGGFVGHPVWGILLYSFIAGGILAAIQMLYHRILVSRMKSFWSYIHTCYKTRQIIPYHSGFDQGYTGNTIHFSIAICMGYGWWLLERWFNG